MDAVEHRRRSLPWWSADPRTVLELDDPAVARLERKVRRSLRVGEGWELRSGTAFERVLGACAAPRAVHDNVWISPRLAALYRALHAAGYATSWEIWCDDELGAGAIAVHVQRAVMLESMFHVVSHAGNVLLARLVRRLASQGVALCDVQLPTDHLRRLGAREIPRVEYETRLRVAAGVVSGQEG